MLENTIHWRRDYRPDELDPEYIKPEVSTRRHVHLSTCIEKKKRGVSYG